MFFVLALMTGCMHGTPDPNTGKPQDVKQTIDAIKGGVEAAGSIAELVCDLQQASSVLCESLQNSWKVVQLAIAEVDKLYDVYEQTGLGLELVYTAIDHLVIAIRSMEQNADTVRSFADAYRIPASSAVAGGLPDQPVADNPAPLKDPYPQSAPAPCVE